MRTRQTLNHWLIGLESCCGSTRMGPSLPTIRRAFQESRALPPASIGQFGPSGYAIPLLLGSSPGQAGSSLTTLDKAPGKKSTTASPDQTMGGAFAKDFVHRPTRTTEIHYLNMAMARAAQLDAPLLGAPSTILGSA